jgi:hypothetical protein
MLLSYLLAYFGDPTSDDIHDDVIDPAAAVMKTYRKSLTSVGSITLDGTYKNGSLSNI